MSDQGFFFVHRGIFNHPLLTQSGPYSVREAWLWLVSEAAWAPRKVGGAGSIIVLDRGQLSHSIRFLADKWAWDKARVSRFLTRLKTETMIETVTEAGQTVITICNYNAYQISAECDRDSERDSKRDATETAARQRRRSKNINTDILSETGVSDSANPKPAKRAKGAYTPEFEAFWKAYPSTEGHSKVKGFAAWQKLSPADHAQAMGSLADYARQLAKNPTQSVKHVQGFLSERRFETFGSSTPAPVKDWATRIEKARQWRSWPVGEWGPMPGQPGCLVPVALLLAGDGDGWKPAASDARLHGLMIEWRAEYDAVYRTADARADAHMARLYAIEQEAAAIRPATIEGLAIKLLLLTNYGEFDLDDFRRDLLAEAEAITGYAPPATFKRSA